MGRVTAARDRERNDADVMVQRVLIQDQRNRWCAMPRAIGRHLTTCCTLVMVALVVAGCDSLSPEVSESDPEQAAIENDAPVDPAQPNQGRDTSVFDRPVQRLVVEFKVHRFTAARGTFSDDSRLWKLVTGKLPVASERLRLADNGFRAAIGRESDRFPLREWLDSMEDIGSASDTAAPDASKLVDVNIGSCGPQIVVFHYDATGSLIGHEFLNAKARFRIAFELRPPDLQTSILTVVPEIEEPPGPPKWIITEAGARQVPQERRYPFDDLKFRAEIPAGGFLLLGPLKSVYDQPLLGRAFFGGAAPARVASEDVVPTESIFVISPVIRAYTDAERAAHDNVIDSPM